MHALQTLSHTHTLAESLHQPCAWRTWTLLNFQRSHWRSRERKELNNGRLWQNQWANTTNTFWISCILHMQSNVHELFASLFFSALFLFRKFVYKTYEFNDFIRCIVSAVVICRTMHISIRCALPLPRNLQEINWAKTKIKFACAEKRTQTTANANRPQKTEKREIRREKTITKCGIHSIPSGRLVW